MGTVSKPRTVRMVAVMDVAVRPHNWNHRHVEEAISALMECLTTASQHPDLRNIEVKKYRVHALHVAYDTLLGVGE